MPGEFATGDHCVYCAGPLFNQSERDEMTAIADCLVDNGCRVYLPHRDGMEFRLIMEILVERGWPGAQAAEFLHAAIFALDVYQLAVECDAMVWNLNGRTPDEGAVSEAAMAWTLGKPLVAYMNDVRSLIAGRVNPLLVGMVDFATVEDVAQIPQALRRAIREAKTDREPRQHNQRELPPKMRRAVADGRQLWQTMTARGAQYHDELIADAVEEIFAPREKTSV